MLVLTRRPGEGLKIGKDIVVTVLGIKGSQVRIGLDAPKHVPIHRQELYYRICAERQRQRDSKRLPGAVLDGTVR